MQTEQKMSLSQAIREGSKLRPQGFGFFNPQVGASCAYEAAIEATLGTSDVYADGNHEQMLALYGSILTSHNHCPVCNGMPRKSLRSIVCHLNDFHRWTREAIADFVESIEAKGQK